MRSAKEAVGKWDAYLDPAWKKAYGQGARGVCPDPPVSSFEHFGHTFQVGDIVRTIGGQGSYKIKAIGSLSRESGWLGFRQILVEPVSPDAAKISSMNLGPDGVDGHQHILPDALGSLANI